MARTKRIKRGKSVRIQVREFPETTFDRIRLVAIDNGIADDVSGIVRWALTQFATTLDVKPATSNRA